MPAPHAEGVKDNGRSAESIIAIALLAVCLVVGAALWWLGSGETEPSVDVRAVTGTQEALPTDEAAALDEQRRSLGEQFDQIDRERQRAEDQKAGLARREAERAAAAQASARAEQARQREDEAKRRQEQAARVAVEAPRAVPAPAPRRAAVVIPAAIDWTSCRRPQYPQASLRRSEEGVVMAEVELDASAAILGGHVLQTSGHDRLDRAALDAILRCRFSPETVDGVARASKAQVRFAWKLEK